MATLTVTIRCVRVPTDAGNRDLYFTQLKQMNVLSNTVAATKESKAVEAALKALEDKSYKSDLLAALEIEEDAYTEALDAAKEANSYDGLVTFFLTFIPDEEKLVAFFKMAGESLKTKHRSHSACFRFLFADIVSKMTGAEDEEKNTVGPFNYENVAAAAKESGVLSKKGVPPSDFLKTIKWINTAAVLQKSVTAESLTTLNGEEKKVPWAAYYLPNITAALGLPSIGDIPEKPKGSPLEGIKKKNTPKKKAGKGGKAKKAKDDAKPADADAKDDASEAATEAAAPEAADEDEDEDESDDDAEEADE